MRLSRALTSQICRVLIGVLLLAQLAVAAYACPGLARVSQAMSADVTIGATPVAASQGQAAETGAMAGGCDQMDLDSHAANLCLEHCRLGQQSSDTAVASVAFAPAPALLYVVSTDPEPGAGVSGSTPAGDPLLSAAPPPHAILHCVLRI